MSSPASSRPSPTTAFWVGEYGRDEIATAPEFAVADGIISLTTRREAERAIRHLEVLKLRGTGFMSGEHAYRIAPDGLHVFPRLAESVPVETYELQTERMSSGIPAIDQMLVDGYWPGASTMVAGPSGSGKTLMGLHFIFNGAAAGQPGIIATLQENSTQLDRIVKGFGWSLASESVELMYRSPVDLYLDEWVYDLIEVIERTRARRVFIDSLGDLRRAAVDELRFREYLYSLLQRCANQQISVMMSQEIPALFGISHISEDGISHISDNVILLQFVPRDAATTACRDGAQDPRNQTRSRRPRVHDHPGRHRARRAAQQLDALTTGIDAEEQHALKAGFRPRRGPCATSPASSTPSVTARRALTGDAASEHRAERGSRTEAAPWATIHKSRSPAAGSRLRSDSAPRASTLRWASSRDQLFGRGRRIEDAVSGGWHRRAGTLAGEDLGHLDGRPGRAGERKATDEDPDYENQRSNEHQGQPS